MLKPFGNAVYHSLEMFMSPGFGLRCLEIRSKEFRKAYSFEVAKLNGLHFGVNFKRQGQQGF